MSNFMQTALVLQGGGALGAYEVGVIKALYEQPDFMPHIVTGVSIGALNAAVLVGGGSGPVQALERMWNDLAVVDIPFAPDAIEESLAALGNAAMYQMNPAYIVAPFLATSIYDTAPLRHSIERWVDFDTLNNSATYVAVTAVNIETGELETFDNRRGLSADHLVASTSLPPAFPITQVDGNAYWDGGLVSNAPLGCALNALEDFDHREIDTQTEVIVVDLFRNSATVPGNLLDVMWRSFEIMFSSKLKQDLKVFRKVNAYIALLEEVGEALPEDSPVRQHPGFAALTRYRKVDRLTVIDNSDTGDAGGPANFASSEIERRIANGYRDAKQQYTDASP